MTASLRVIETVAEKRLDGLASSESNIVQLEVLLEALKVYDERNVKYKDNWKRFGWRGCLFRLRERTERAWDDWFHGDVDIDEMPDVDDLIDLINFAAFTIRAIREGNRDGSWFS